LEAVNAVYFVALGFSGFRICIAVAWSLFSLFIEKRPVAWELLEPNLSIYLSLAGTLRAQFRPQWFNFGA
jgi:hypothetical protein